MQDHNFRPVLDGLEDRTVPSITPGDVVTAYVHTMAVKDELAGVTEHLNDLKTSQTLSFLPTHLRERADSSQADVRILAEYLHELQSEIATNPPNAAFLNQFAGGIGFAEYQATINATYAEFYALGYGAPVRVPPVPPPGVDNGVNFGQLPCLEAGSLRITPTGSTGALEVPLAPTGEVCDRTVWVAPFGASSG